MEIDELALDHPRFRRVTAAIFTRRMAPDCMTHRCATVMDEVQGVLAQPRHQFDVCCQYGCDVDLAERDAILARSAELSAVLTPAAAATPWFGDEIWDDADYPSGQVVRTAVHGAGCIFLAHDRRGCAIHRAALEGGWDLHGVKPAVCRLYPVSYEGDAIVIAGEYPEYSCAHVTGPTLYRLAREAIGELFGAELVAALDAVEARVVAADTAAGATDTAAGAADTAAGAADTAAITDGPRRLPVVRS